MTMITVVGNMVPVKIMVSVTPINFVFALMITLEISVKYMWAVTKIPAPTINVSMEVFALWIQKPWRPDAFVIADTEESTARITIMDNA